MPLFSSRGDRARSHLTPPVIEEFQGVEASSSAWLLRLSLVMRDEFPPDAVQVVLQAAGETLARLDPLPGPSPGENRSLTLSFGCEMGALSLADRITLTSDHFDIDLPQPTLARRRRGAQGLDEEREAAARFEDIDDLKRTVYRYHVARRDAEAVAATAVARQEEAEARAAMLEREIEAARADHRAAEAQIARLDQDRVRSGTRAQNLEAELENANAAARSELETVRSEARATAERLEEELQSTRDASRAEVERLQSGFTSAVGALEAERDALVAEREALIAERDGAVERAALLDEQTATIRSEHDRLNEELAEARSARDRFEAEARQAAEAQDAALSAAAATYDADLQELRAELFAAHDRIAELDAALAFERARLNARS